MATQALEVKTAILGSQPAGISILSNLADTAALIAVETAVLATGSTAQLADGSLYYFNATLSSGGLSPTSGGGQWLPLSNGKLTPKSFGATGNGSTDDTVAFQKALDNCGSYLFVTGGTYILDGVTFPENTRLEGENSELCILKLKASSVNKIISQALEDNVKIENVSFDLNAIADSVALEIQGSNVSVTECQFNGNYGVYLTGAAANIKISKCFFLECNYSVVTGEDSTTENVTIENCTFKDGTGDGVEINCPTGSAKDWVITGNLFDTLGSDVVGKGFGVGASGGSAIGVTDLIISNNVFHRCDQQGCHIEDGCRNVLISNNIFKDIGYGGTQTYRDAIHLEASVVGREISNIQIVNNNIQGIADMVRGIFVGPSVAASLITIKQNTILKASTVGIFLGSLVTDFSVIDNLVFNGGGKGIITAANFGVFAGNIISDNQTPKTQTYAVEITGGTDVVFSYNIVKGNLTGTFQITTPGTRNVFAGNIETDTTDLVFKDQTRTMLTLNSTANQFPIPFAFNTVATVSLDGTTNNIAIGVGNLLRVDAAINTPAISGIVARSNTFLVILNNTGNSFTLLHQNAGSDAANRIVLRDGGPLTIASGRAFILFYSADLSKWQAFSL